MQKNQLPVVQNWRARSSEGSISARKIMVLFIGFIFLIDCINSYF